MAISFSGLASGLDTASWVTSLTQLRQAKVTKLEEQKQSIVTAQSTLQGIRSFFSSFRASLEKITDSKFKVSSMDIFSKKIAEVSNAAILSATAKSNAAEGSYEVKINNIATQTQAKSGYRYKTTIISTTQASTTSYLKNVGVGYGTNPSDGVTPGNIEITHNGVTSTIEISANETMGSFLDKLHNVGINADFDNSTGIFSIDVNVGDINDVGNTNILNKLKISNINYGYTGNQLKIEETHEEYHQATNDTLLSELGVHAGTLTLTASDGVYEVTLANNETIGSLVSSLRDAGINATFNDGVFSIDNAYISNDGTTDLIERFGLNTNNISSQTQESGGLTYQTVYTETTTAKLNTLLKNINGVTLEGNQTIAVEDESGGLHTINVGTTTTIGDMVNAMNAPGINLGASFNETTGILSINNGWIVTGGTFDVEAAFGLVYTGEDAVVTGSSLTVSTTTVTGATDSTKLKDLSTAVTNGTIKVTDTLGAVHNVVINNESTIGSFVSTIRGLGLGAEFDNTTGVLTLTGGSYTTDGIPSGNASNILEVFYGTNTLTPSAIDSATSTSSALYQTVTSTAAATGTTQLSQLNGSGSTGTHTHTFNVNGNTVSFNIADNATINQLVSTMRSNGIDASFDPSTSTISMRGAQYVSSTAGFDLGSIMNFTETITGRYVTSNSVMAQNVTTGNTMTSASQVNYTVETTTTVTTDITGTIASTVASSLTYNVTTPGSTTTTTTGMTTTSDTMLITTTSGITQSSGSLYTDGTTTGITATTGTMTIETTSGVTQTSVTMYTDGTTTGITATTDTMTINTTSGVTQTSGALYTDGTTTGIAATSSTMTIETTSGITQTSCTMYTDGTTSGITQTTGTMYTATTSATSQTSAILYTDTTTPANVTSGVLTYETTTFNPGATTTTGITMTSGTLYLPGSIMGATQTLSAITMETVGAGTTTGLTGTQTSTPEYTSVNMGTSFVTTGLTTTLQTGVLTYEQVSSSGGSTTTINGTNTTYVMGVVGDRLTTTGPEYRSKPQTVTVTATTSTTLGQLGYTGTTLDGTTNVCAVVKIKNIGGGSEGQVTILTTDTLTSLKNKLQAAGVNVSLTTSGNKVIAKINAENSTYSNHIDNILIPNSSSHTCVFTGGLGYSYNITQVETAMDENTGLPRMGEGAAGRPSYWTITTKGGSSYTVADCEGSGKIGDFLDVLRGLGYSAGITDGHVWFTPGANMNPNNAIDSVTGDPGGTDLLDWLGLPTSIGSGVTYQQGYSNTSVCRYSKQFTLCADNTTTHKLTDSLATIYGYEAGTSIIVENTSGQKITVSTSTSLGSFINQMNTQLGLSFTIYGNGSVTNYDNGTSYKTIKIVCTSAGSSVNGSGTKALAAIYTTSTSGDPDAPPIDVSQVGYGKTYYRYQTSYNVTGGSQTTTTVTATGSTTLGQLGLQASQTGYNIETDTGTINVNSGTTLNQLITALGTAGITATLATSGTNKGKLTINNTESHYIASMGVVANTLGISVGESITFETEASINYSTTTVTATGSTTLEELVYGDSGCTNIERGDEPGEEGEVEVVAFDIVLFNANKGVYETIIVPGSYTLNELNSSSTFSNFFSFNTSFTGHTLEFTGYAPSTNQYITYMDPGLANALGIQVGNGHSYTVSGGTTTTVTATASDTLGDFHGSGGTIILANTESATFDASSTYQDILDFLDDNGITASFTNGVFTVGSPSDYNYIASGKIGLSNFAEILSGNGISYTHTEPPLATGNEAINSLLGWSFGNDDITIATDSTTITVASSSTINQLVGAINSIGNNDFTASYSNGTFTITPTEGHYITSVSENLESPFGMRTGEGLSYQTVTGSATGETITHTASTTTTMYQLGMHSQGTIELSNGSIITVETSDTISDLQDYLDGYDITNSFAGGIIDIGDPGDDIYITNMSSNLASALGIEAGQGHTYSITQNGTVITTSNTLSELGLNTSANIVNNANQTITVTGSDSIQDLIDALDDIGITATLNAGGTFTLGDAGDSNYITSIDAALQVALGLTAGAGSSYTTGTGTASSGATLAQLGMSGDSARIITDTGTINLTSTSTLQNLQDQLATHGITAALSNGQFTFTPSAGHYIQSMSGNLETLFGIYAGQGDSYNANGSATATSATTLGSLGITGTKYIVTSNNTITLNSGSTLQNVIDGLGSAGISATLANGVMTFTPSAGHYIESMSAGLEVLFDIETGVGQSYSLNSVTAGTSATLAQLGMAGSSAYIVTDSGTLNFSSNSTLAEIIPDLTDAGITASLSNGQLTFTPTAGHYIQSMSSNLEAVLGIYAGQGSTYGSNGSATATTATTLGALGITGTKYIVTSDNTITLNSGSTLQNVIDGLGSAGITATLANGIMTFTPSAGHYIESMSSGLEVLFDIETGQGQSYNLNSVTASLSATLAQLGMTGDSARIITSDGTIDLTANSTLQNIRDQLASHGITASLSNGKFTFTPSAGHYIQSMSGNLESLFGMYAGQGDTYGSNGSATVTTATTLGDLGMTGTKYIVTSDNTITLTSTSTLQNVISGLGSASITATLSNGVMTFTPSAGHYIESMSSGLEAIFDIETGQGESYNLNSVTASIGATLAQLGMTGDSARIVTSDGTINLTATSTLQNIRDQLSSHGITASLSNGQFTFTPSAGHYIQSMSGNLESLFEMYAGQGDTYGTSGSVTASTATTLGDLGLTGTKYIVTSDNTITLTSTSTLQNVISGLGSAGISATLANGVMTFTPSAGHYIESMSAGLETIFDIETGQNNSFSINSVTATLASTLADIGMRGSSGHIITDSGTLNFTSNSTLQDVINSLGTAGITATLSNGVMSFNPSEGHYIYSVSNYLAAALGMDSGYGSTYGTTVNTTPGSTVTHTATTATSLSTLGMTENGIIVTNNGNINISTDDTIGSLITKLGNANITANYNSSTGIFTLGNEGDTNYVTAMSPQLAQALGNIVVGLNASYQFATTGQSTTTNTVTTTQTVTGSNTFSDIGINSQQIITLSNGNSVTINPGTTISSFLSDISGKGINASLQNGIFLLEPQNGVYITNDSGDAILEALHIMGSEISVSQLNLGQTKLKDLRDGSGNALNITSGAIRAYKNGIQYNIAINNDTTLEDLATQLRNYNIEMSYSAGSEGAITFTGTGNSYLSEVSGGTNLLTKLGATSWNSTVDSVSQALAVETPHQDAIDGNTKITAIVNSTGSSIGLTTGKYKIVAGGINYEGSIGANTTVNDFFNQLSLYGISGSINSDGQITLSTTNDDTYLVKANGASGYSNIVDTLFQSWTFGNIYVSDSMDVTNITTNDITSETKLRDIDQGTYVPGKFVVSRRDEADQIINLAEDATVGDFMAAISYHGFTSYIEGGKVIIRNDGYATLNNYTDVPSQASNVLGLLGLNTAVWENPGHYLGTTQTTNNYDTVYEAATRNTKLSELRDASGNSLGITTGEYYVYTDGVRHALNLTSTDITLESFMNTLESYGINTILDSNGSNSVLKLIGSGDSYIAPSTAPGASNVVTKLFGNSGPDTLYDYDAYLQTTELVSTTVIAGLGTFVSDYDQNPNKSEGIFAFSVDGNYSQISITAYETFGSLLEKFERAGVQASLENGVLRLETGNKSFVLDTENTTSHLIDNLGLHFSDNLGGFAASTDAVTQTTTTIEDRTLSVAQYADDSTQISLLNISSGTFSVYRNGEKKVINIDNTETFSDLRSRLTAAFGSDINMSFENGKLVFYSNNENIDVQVGSSNDTSNISSICGFSQDENGRILSARELYKVNASSVITTSNLFRYGNVTEGTFTIGDDTFTITSSTTIQNIIAQINSSEKANASAYWDSVDGKLVISARNTGASMVNIEAGTSNFTDILGLTTSEWNGDGSLKVTKIRLDSQEIGQNAKFSINGTNFQSASNVVTSDISRIQGLTLNLKSASMGDTITVTVGKDTEAVTEAVGEFVESYNELVENVDAELNAGGILKDQSTLKFIKQQIRNLLVNTFAGATTFRNLAALGISTSSGNTVGLDTSNAGIEYLYFDAEKFMEGYNKDADAVKNMLVGSDETPGILIQIENIVENALATGSGYFSVADKSYSDKITSINEKIKKANQAIEAYRARLESKFQSMDLLISQMQNQYNSFLGKTA